MSKYKYFLCAILWTFMPQLCMAVDLELSDVIREAREVQMKVADKTEIQQNVQKTRDEYKAQSQIQGEKSACEKLNPEEIIKQK